MGTDFKAPPHKDVEQWHKVEALALAGVRFFPQWSSGCPGERPETLAGVPTFLRHFRPPSEGQRLLERAGFSRTKAQREGRLEQHGSFPTQIYFLLGQRLESQTPLEMFTAGAWRPVQFISRGSGNVALRQPYALPRLTSIVQASKARTFLTSSHRLRWPQT